MLFVLLWNMSDCFQNFLDKMAVANTEATEPSIPTGLAEVITSTVIGRHYDMVNRHGISMSQMTWICFVCRKHFSVLSSLRTCHRICVKSYTIGSTCRTVTAYPFRASCFAIVSFLCCVLWIIVCPLSTFIWPLYCLSFFYLRILLTHQIFLNKLFHKNNSKQIFWLRFL